MFFIFKFNNIFGESSILIKIFLLLCCSFQLTTPTSSIEQFVVNPTLHGLGLHMHFQRFEVDNPILFHCITDSLLEASSHFAVTVCFVLPWIELPKRSYLVLCSAVSPLLLKQQRNLS